jgi:hypothetical protein
MCEDEVHPKSVVHVALALQSKNIELQSLLKVLGYSAESAIFQYARDI